MSRTTYTSTASYPLAVGWKCTKCGKYSAKLCPITQKASGSNQGTWAKKSTIDQAQNSAQAMLKISLITTLNSANNGQYGTYLQDCWCSSCYNKEPWSKHISFSGFTAVLGLLTWIAILGAISSLLSLDLWGLLFTLAVAAVAVLAIKFLNRLEENKNASIKEHINSLSLLERPVIALTPDMLQEQMNLIFAPDDPDEKFEIEKAVSEIRNHYN